MKRSTYEGRGHARPRSVTVADGRILGTVNERDEFIPFDQPPADRRDLWPNSWWRRIWPPW
jgi:hypothetical protein